jgi:hypothetical protein
MREENSLYENTFMEYFCYLIAKKLIQDAYYKTPEQAQK